MERLSIIDDEDEFRKVESMANGELCRDMMRDIREGEQTWKFPHYMAVLYLENIRPLIEVGRNTLSVKITGIMILERSSTWFGIELHRLRNGCFVEKA